MLQLRAAAFGRIPASPVCSTCLVGSRNRLPLWHHSPASVPQSAVATVWNRVYSDGPKTSKPTGATQSKPPASEKPASKKQATRVSRRRGNTKVPTNKTPGAKSASKAADSRQQKATGKAQASETPSEKQAGGSSLKKKKDGLELPKSAKARAAAKPKRESDTTAATALSGALPADILREMSDTYLKRLEGNYSNIARQLKMLQSPSAKTAEKNVEKTDAGKRGDESERTKRTTLKLESQLEMISGTLNVVKNVLASNEISIDTFRKRPGKTTEPPAKAAKVSGRTTRSPATDDASKGRPGKPTEGPAVPPRKLQGGLPPTVASALKTSSDLTMTRATRGNTEDEKTPTTPAPPKTTSRKPSSTSRRSKDLEVERVNPKDLQLTPIEQESMPEVPALAYDLHRVLFNQGVHQLRDPRSRVYNFDPYLSKIMPANEFDFGALQQYITSSKDHTMYDLANQLGKKYTGSTSSMTAVLAHFHYLLSAWRPLNFKNLSRSFTPEFHNFTNILRAPAAAFLQERDGVYAIDADKEFDTANVLMLLGKSMEKLLTLDTDDFEKYRRQNSDQITEEERNAPEAYHFTTMGDFLMRSQLDAFDKRLPGTGMFDLKTRAVLSIRMDTANYQQGTGYELLDRFGEFSSYEREYYDMIRAAFLKYSLQVRMGRMDGIFVAFHNTERIFGFQYIPLEEMDQAIHGTNQKALGDQEFKLSVKLLNEALDRATKRFPNRPIRLHVETRPGNPPFMYIFAEATDAEAIAKVQSSAAQQVADFEKRLMRPDEEESQLDKAPTATDSESVEELVDEQDFEDEGALQTSSETDEMSEPKHETSQQTLAIWESMQRRVEEAVEDDALGVGHVREAIQDALEQSGLLKTKTFEESRSYVESLLEALTQTAEMTGRTAEDGTTEAVAGVESDVEGTATVDVAPSAGSSSETPGASESLSSKADGFESEEPATSSSSEYSTTSCQQEDAAVSSATSAKSTDPSLKELIMRIAEHVDEKPEVMSSTDASNELASQKAKLQDFGKILSRLVQTSREDQVSWGSSETYESSTTFEDESTPSSPEPAESGADQASSGSGPTEPPESTELLGMFLTIRNKVSGSEVDRPHGAQAWEVEYAFEEISDGSARHIYQAMKSRRKKMLKNDDAATKAEQWKRMFGGKLVKSSRRGQAHRIVEDKADLKNPIYRVESTEPISWNEAYGRHAQWKSKG